MKVAITIVFSTIFMWCGIVFPQDIDVELNLESREFSIGDWIPITITAEHDSNTLVYSPEPGEKIGKLHFIDRKDLTSETNENKQIHRWLLTVSAYDTGYFSIPPIPINYVTKSDTIIHSVFTDSTWVIIVSAGGDTLTDIHDIKPPLGIKRAFEDYLPYLMIFIILVLLVFGYWVFKKFYSKPKEIESVSLKPEIDPYEHAMKRMVELKNKQLWQKGFVKKHFTEVAEIVKEYIELEYNFNALELTTEEFIEVNNEKKLVSDTIVRKFLNDADLVKFAKFIPQPEDCENSIEVAYSILKEAHSNTKKALIGSTVTDMINPLEQTDKTQDSNVHNIDGDR